MERDVELQLIQRCLDQIERTPGDDAATRPDFEVPVAKYIEPEWYALEQERIFRAAPNLVCHVSEVAEPGSFVTREVAGLPVIVARDESGTLRAMLNVCRHRGAKVEQRDAGTCKRFVCPYHAWTYRTDGSLDRVRFQSGFPSLEIAETSLVRLPVVESAGLVWVIPDPDHVGPVEPLPDSLAREIESTGIGALAPYETSTREWAANWKLIVDGGLEAYHFKIAHQRTVAQFFLDTVSIFDNVDEHVRTVLPRVTFTQLGERPPEKRNLRPHSNVLYSIYPNASLLVQPDHVVLVLLRPLAVDRTEISVTSLVPPGWEDSDKARGYWSANHQITNTTLEEDFAIAELIHAGASSGANETWRFASYEHALSRWHAMYDAKLA